MFGFFKSKRAANEATSYCTVLLAGMADTYGKPVPSQIFGDAYIAGFAQQLIMHAAVQAGVRPDDGGKLSNIAEAAYEKLAPGFGHQIIVSLLAVNATSHPHNVHYKVGRREGAEYVAALLKGDEAAMRDRAQRLRNFIARNYLVVEI